MMRNVHGHLRRKVIGKLPEPAGLKKFTNEILKI